MDPYPGSRFRRSEMNYPQQPPPMPSTLSARSSGQAYQGNDRQNWQAATTSQREPYAKSFREGFYPNQRKQEPESMSWQHKEKAGLPEVPAEVKKLMTNFNLSPADLQKLSQMPENQISLSNLARVIGDLKQQKESPRKEQPKPMPNTRSRQPPQTSYNRDSFNPKSLLGAPPSGGFSGRFSESAQRPNTALKNKPDGLKVNSITSCPPRGQQMTYDDRSYRKSDDFYNEPLYHAVNRAHDDNPSYARSNYKAGQSSRFNEEQDYGRQRMHAPEGPPRGGSQGQGRGLLKRPESSFISNSPRKQIRNERPKSGSLLGNPMQPNPLALETLAASVGHSSPYVSQAALLNPLMLAHAQQDPSILEAQLNAIKALQAEASGRRQEPTYDQRAPDFHADNRDGNERERRSGGGGDFSLLQIRKQVDEMRKNEGRVLYLRYKSNRIDEADLRQLADAFGRVTNLLTVKAKVQNGHHQAFMEMEQWDCAAAMLERYMTKPPTIRGCPIQVQKSNYKDLKLRYAQNRIPVKRNRSLSISPVRRGTTQLSEKRLRSGRDGSKDRTRDKKRSRSSDKPRLNVSLSANKRVVTRGDEKRRSDRDKDSRRSPRRSPRRREPRKSNENRKKTPDRKSSEKVEKKPDTKVVEKKKEEEVKEKKIDPDLDAGKIKEDFDPLDTIANELALHDEFVLMDEVGYGSEAKKAEGKCEKNDLADLEGGVLDLENVNVDDSAEDEDLMHDVEGTDDGDDGLKKSDEIEAETTDQSDAKNEGRVDGDNTDDKEVAASALDPMNEDSSQDDSTAVESKFEDKKEQSFQVEEELNETGIKESNIDSKNSENEAADLEANDLDFELDGNDVSVDPIEDELVQSKDAGKKLDVGESSTDVVVNSDGVMGNGEQDIIAEIVPDSLVPKSQEKDESKEVKSKTNSVNGKVEEHSANDIERENDDVIKDDDVTMDDEGHVNDESSDEHEEEAEQTEVSRLKEILAITLTYVENAQDHLTALTKVTKNKAAQAVAKKLRTCLDDAASTLKLDDDVIVED